MSVTQERLNEKLEQGQFYDYSQLLKTMFFKLKMKRKEDEQKQLIQKALSDLKTHN